MGAEQRVKRAKTLEPGLNKDFLFVWHRTAATKVPIDKIYKEIPSSAKIYVIGNFKLLFIKYIDTNSEKYPRRTDTQGSMQ